MRHNLSVVNELNASPFPLLKEKKTYLDAYKSILSFSVLLSMSGGFAKIINVGLFSTYKIGNLRI